VAVEFADYVEMDKQNTQTVFDTLFHVRTSRELIHSGLITNHFVNWDLANQNILRKYEVDPLKGYVCVQGKGKVKGKLLGGCLETFTELIGTSLWPKLHKWKDKILFIDPSEEKSSPAYLKWFLLNLATQGILSSIKGILIARGVQGTYFHEYNEVLLKIAQQYNLPNLVIIANCQFGHSYQWNILPIGCEIEIDCDLQTLTLLEKCVIK
jgi:muramoyltetrapeptide carboxypeptidase LdcA involved in peptidoglycan recycling